MSKRALVLGGGGVAGIAWMTGVLAALADGDVDVTGADRVVGTSAGSAVAAQVTSGLPLSALLERQVDPALQTLELPSGVPMEELWAKFQEVYESTPDPVEQRRRIGALALAADTISEARRREVIGARLPVHEWPERDLVIVAVEAVSGEPRLFEPGSGVGLVDAVAASCAVPGVWPCVTIDGVRYMDGGVRTSTNSDFAAGFDKVLVLAPMPDLGEPSWAALDGRVEVIEPDADSLAADTISEARRREVIGARLPVHEWPERDLVIVAVEAVSGEPRLFEPGSGVGLVDAVAASCAVPGVWPCVTIDGVRYMDGGVRTSTNSDFAAGFDKVLVLAPMPDLGEPSWAALDGRVEVIEPDADSLAAAGADPLSPEVRAPSARAGYAQGRSAVTRVAAHWR